MIHFITFVISSSQQPPATMTLAPGITKVWGPALPKRPRWIRGWPKKKTQRWDGATRIDDG